MKEKIVGIVVMAIVIVTTLAGCLGDERLSGHLITDEEGDVAVPSKIWTMAMTEDVDLRYLDLSFGTNKYDETREDAIFKVTIDGDGFIGIEGTRYSIFISKDDKIQIDEEERWGDMIDMHSVEYMIVHEIDASSVETTYIYTLHNGRIIQALKIDNKDVTSKENKLVINLQINHLINGIYYFVVGSEAWNIVTDETSYYDLMYDTNADGVTVIQER